MSRQKLKTTVVDLLDQSGVTSHPYYGQKVRMEVENLSQFLTQEQFGQLWRLLHAVIGSATNADPNLPHHRMVCQAREVVQVRGNHEQKKA